MELVGAHKEALSALVRMELSNENSIQAIENGPLDAQSGKQIQNEEPEDASNPKSEEIELKQGQIVQEEEREKGRVGFWVYKKYITTAYKGALVPLILLAQILFQVLQIGSNYWMAWAAPVSKDLEAPVGVFTLLYVYVALAMGSSLCILIRAFLLMMAGYKTATILFNKMHFSIFRAPMSFFDSTPSGRILNRV